LLRICTAEGVKLKDEAVLDSLIKVTDGDLRRSINTLQTCSTFCKSTGLSQEDIESVSGIVPYKVVLHTDTVCATKGITYNDILKHAESLVLEGYDCQQLLHQLQDFYSNNSKVTDIKKAKVAEIIAQTDFNFCQNGNEEINLLYTLSSISQILNSK
jgi:DNA polymerase III delta prime subunit